MMERSHEFGSVWQRLKTWANFRDRSNTAILTLVILNFCITLSLAAILSIWFDEAYALDTTSRTLSYALHQSIYFEEQAPLYFILLTLWRSFNDSIFFARLLSVFCIGATLYIISLVSKRFLTALNPAWLVALVAFNPYVISIAVEVRLYAFSTLLAALLLLFFHDGYLNEQRQSRAQIIYILLAVISLYTHYFLAFLLVANGLALWWLGRTKAFWQYVRDLAIAGLFFVPMVIHVMWQLSQLTDNPEANMGVRQFSISYALRGSIAGLLRYTLPAQLDEQNSGLWRSLRVLLFAGILTFLIKYRRSMSQNHRVIWMLTGLLIVIFFMVFNLTGETVSFRHTSVLLLPSLLSVVAVLSLVQNARSTRTVQIFCSTLLCLYAFSLSLTYAPLTKPGDYVRVASYLMAHETANQPILVFNPEVEMALKHYYEGKNFLVALPKPENFRAYDWRELALNDEQEIISALSQASGDRSQVWLVADSKLVKDTIAFASSFQVLEDFVSKYYTVISNRDFYGTNIRLLKQIQELPQGTPG